MVLDIKQDTHITMCAGKAGAIERVSFNHKLETVAKAVQTAIKDPLKVDHEGRPAMTAELNLNQPKINVEISPVFNHDTEDSDEDLEFDEDVESLRIWNLVDEDLKYIENQKFSEYEKIPPLSEYDLEDESEYDLEDESTHEERGLKHDKEITESCASSPLPSQAKETSNKPPQNDNSSRKGIKVKKLESIRLGAILPDNIWLSNHMTCSRMSTKEYNTRCKSLRKNCKNSIDCNAHTSLKNLRRISKDLKIVLAQTGELSKDWDEKKKVHSGKYGYLNIAINYPEILRETKLIKQLVKSFNKSREDMWKYKDVILSYHKKNPDFIKVDQTAPKDHIHVRSPTAENNTVSRLVKKLSPYNEREFKIISSRAFLSVHIREILFEWEKIHPYLSTSLRLPTRS